MLRPKPPPLPLFAELKEWDSFRLGFDRLQRVLEALGGPQRSFPHVLVGGTNGKGTVAYNLALNLPFPKVGLFLSPHVLDIRERITVADAWVVDALWREAYEETLQAVGAEPELSYFEWLLVLALAMFRRMRVDYAVFEVGVGGRDDATNLLDPNLSIVTGVAMDHVGLLGNSIEEIALAKIEIARRNRPFILPEAIQAMPAVHARLREIGCTVHTVETENRFQDNESTLKTALDVLGFPRKERNLTLLPGRRAIFGGSIFADGAHNEAAWEDLVAWIEGKAIDRIDLLCGVSLGRDPLRFLEIVKPISGRVHVWTGGFQRGLPEKAWPAELFRAGVADLPELFKKPLLICGSLYLLGAVLPHLEAASINR